MADGNVTRTVDPQPREAEAMANRTIEEVRLRQWHERLKEWEQNLTEYHQKLITYGYELAERHKKLHAQEKAAEKAKEETNVI